MILAKESEDASDAGRNKKKKKKNRTYIILQVSLLCQITQRTNIYKNSYKLSILKFLKYLEIIWTLIFLHL